MSYCGLRIGAVDVHAHLTPKDFPPNETSEARWPCMQSKSATETTILMGDKSYRSFDHRSWDVDRRIRDMDQAGVAVQVLFADTRATCLLVHCEQCRALM
jgi:hypothetical protein